MWIRGLGVTCLVLAWSSAAVADEPAREETPWSVGVSAERKAAAEQLLGEGNQLFVQNKFPEALAKYEQAIAQWDHPAIHFNIVRALLALDRPVDAQASLEKALAYGAAALDDHYAEAINYKNLIAARIGTLELSCKQPGVKIKLDGSEVVTCPGRTAKRLLPGNHAIVGTKPGYQTENRDVVIVGGAQQQVEIRLLTTAEATTYRSRWATWKPWAVTAGGAVLVGVGALLRRGAQSDLDDLKDTIVATCPPEGCTEQQYEQLGHASSEARIERQGSVAVGLMIGGGVIVTAGIVAVILNRPKPYIRERPSTTARVVPALTPTGAGLSLLGSF